MAGTFSLQAGKIAVFNPETSSHHRRFSFDFDFYKYLSELLTQNEYEVERLTADQITNAEIFNANDFDVIFFEGSAVPRTCIPIIKTFTKQGGVLVNIGGGVPLLVAIEPAPDGEWQMSPMTPKFAWQTRELHDHFGFRYVYNPLMHDQGKEYAVTPLLTTYLPEAQAPVHAIKHSWLVNHKAGVFYPLISAKRIDGADVTPQVFVAENQGAKAIITLSKFLTNDSRPEEWTQGEALLLAITDMAVDLKNGTLKLDPATAIQIPYELPPPEPLQTRKPTGTVEPENAFALKRWGEFNGSSLDLKESELPTKLLPGETVTLDLPEYSDASAYLRIRLAYNATHAGIKIAVDQDSVLNELYVYNDPTGESNNSLNVYSGLPVEITRLVFLPHKGSTLTLSNPGSQPLYLDALQIETRTQPTPERWMGTGGGGFRLKPEQQNKIPLEVSKKWSVLRAGASPKNAGAPDDPNRWDKMKVHMDNEIERSDRLNLAISGTPEWAAISPERYQEGVKARRPRTVPPNPEKYAEIVEWIVTNYQDHVTVYEIWNEPDIQQFWRGTLDEYLVFVSQMVEVILEIDPDANIITAGLAHSEADYIKRLRNAPFAKDIHLVATHPYAAESVSWDIPYGKLQGTLYAMGDGVEIFCNESGFVWEPAEWFKGDWTEERQASATDTAIARIFHGDLSKLSTFHGGGDTHHFGMYDIDGNPRPAAIPFEDYVKISQPGAHRLDVSFLPGDGEFPLQGIYFAGSEYPDGSQAILVNPAESQTFSRPIKICSKVDAEKTFTASAHAAGQEVPVTLTAHEGWVEVLLTVSQRTIIELTPAKK